MDFRFVKLTVLVCIAFFGLMWVTFGDNRRFEDFASGPGTIAFHEGNTLPSRALYKVGATLGIPVAVTLAEPACGRPAGDMIAPYVNDVRRFALRASSDRLTDTGRVLATAAWEDSDGFCFGADVLIRV